MANQLLISETGDVLSYSELALLRVAFELLVVNRLLILETGVFYDSVAISDQECSEIT